MQKHLHFTEFLGSNLLHQMIKMLVPNIIVQAKNVDYPLGRIVIQRDGRLFERETEGIIKAIAILQKKALSEDFN